MSERSASPTSWTSVPHSTMSMEDHKRAAIKAIEAELDSIANDMTTNAEHKADATAYWKNKIVEIRNS